MNIRTTLFCILFLGYISLLASESFAQKSKKAAQSKVRVQPCAAQIDAVLRDTIFRHAFVGIQVVSLKDHKIVYTRNAEKLFRPASNLKLFTTAAALELLGKDFRFKTEVYTDAIQEGVVKGSVYLKGYGDPLLTTAHLDSLARMVYESGVRVIQGDIVGDVSYFDDVFWGKGWMWDDDPGYYWPYFSPLTVNGNTVSVKVLPGITEGDPVSVALEPETSFITVVNRASTTSDTTKPKLTVTRRWKERQNVIVVEGAARPNSNFSTFRFNVWKPELYTLILFKERLLSYGITIRGALRLDFVRNPILLHSISHPLDSVVVFINKESENLAAEQVLKTIAAELRGAPGNTDTAISLVKNFLAGIGIDTATTIIADGSGVSRYNLISPEAIIHILVNQYYNPFTSESFLRSLPIAGIDGTLKSRLTGNPAMGNVRAKTGSHSDASSLSGYITKVNGDVLVFSILFNHFPQNIDLYREAQDRIVEILTNCK